MAQRRGIKSEAKEKEKGKGNPNGKENSKNGCTRDQGRSDKGGEKSFSSGGKSKSSGQNTGASAAGKKRTSQDDSKPTGKRKGKSKC